MPEKRLEMNWKGVALNMKNDYEMYQSVLSRRDEYRRKKEVRRRIIMRTAPVFACCCIAGVVGLNFLKQSEKLPQIPIETEVVSTSAARDTTETTVITLTSSTSPSVSRTTGTSASSKAETTATGTKTANTSSVTQTEKASAAVTENTTVRTTKQTVPATTQNKTTTTASTAKTTSTTTTSAKTTTAKATTALTSQTTTVTGGDCAIVSPSSQENHKPDDVDNGIPTTTAQENPNVHQKDDGNNGNNGKPTTTAQGNSASPQKDDSNRILFQGLKYNILDPISAPADFQEVYPTDTASVYDPIKKENVPIRTFIIGNISYRAAIAIQKEGSDEYLLCVSDYVPESMQTLFSLISLEEWDIKYISYRDTSITDFDRNALMESLITLPDAKNGPSGTYVDAVVIHFRSDVFGYKNMYLTTSGDLMCDFLMTPLSYHVGEENIDKIKELIL